MLEPTDGCQCSGSAFDKLVQCNFVRLDRCDGIIQKLGIFVADVPHVK